MSGTGLGTILIAEDSPPNRKILAHLLEKLGFSVIAFENGQLAWEHLSTGDKNRDIIAIISDIMMPNMDGIQLLRHVRGHDSLKHLPFILVTAVSDKDYVSQSQDLNVNGYILKPVTFQRVTTKLQELFPDKKLHKLTA